MLIKDLFINFFAELVCALSVFLLGYFISKIPKSIENFKLKKLFGPYIFKGRFKIVYGIIRRNIRSQNSISDTKIPIANN